MKKFIIAMLMVFGLAACTKPYQENYPELLLDRYNITLKADGGSVQMMVYYSDAWTAEVSGVNTDWIILSRTGAPGQSYIRITYDSAIDVERTAYVTFYPAHGEPVELKLLQKAK